MNLQGMAHTGSHMTMQLVLRLWACPLTKRCQPPQMQRPVSSPLHSCQVLPGPFLSSDEQQLQHKVDRIKSLFSGWSMPDLQVFSSPQEHYRMR